MSERKTKEYQKLVSEGLRPLLEVETEWRPMKSQSGLYSPRIDIAVGPFVYDNSCIPEEHDRMIKVMEKPITSMLKYHNGNIKRGPIFETFEVTFDELCHNNKNARCLFAIEIENKVNRKHLIGAAVNAIALGRLGIVVALNPDKLEAFTRIRHYLWYLSSATNFQTTNLLILDSEQLLDSFNINNMN